VNSFIAIWAMAKADFLERVRRYSFLLTLVFAVYLGYAAGTGKILIKLGEYRGVYTSAWIGTMMALVTTSFVSLVGFYIVKNAIERDRRTGVGQILATTPLTRPAYMTGKLVSNFGVLAAMVAVLAVAAVVMQIAAGEDRHFDAWALLSPFVLIALPTMALTAAIALLFESLPVLRGGVGNVLWFFLYSFGIGLPVFSKRPWLDPTGLMTVAGSMMDAARKVIPGYKNGFALTIGDRAAQVVDALRWQGFAWSSGEILLRLMWIGAAIVIVLLAAIFFDRFDPSRSRARTFGAEKKQRSEAASRAFATQGGSGKPAAATHLTPLAGGMTAWGFGRIFGAELRLALKGLRWWWYAVATGLLIAQIATPLEISRGPLLGVAWIWPALVWSAMGSREARFDTQQLLFSSAGILRRQLPASWFAGLVVAAFAGAGAAMRLILAGQMSGLAGWSAGALFVPSLALALGVWSRSGKFFEALYTMLWYVGPMNHTPGLDFTGSASGVRAWRYTGMYLGFAGVLVAAAFIGRRRQLRGGGSASR
jgi:hypothetical protein